MAFGVGRQLMGALVFEARASGKHMMIAAIDGANVASIQFHHRLGFVQVARMPEVGAKFGRWQDLEHRTTDDGWASDTLPARKQLLGLPGETR